MVAHFVCILFTGFVLYTVVPGSSLFSWHPVLMTIGFMFLAAEAILVFSPQSSLLQRAVRKTKVTCHWLLMLLATACILAGYGIIYYVKYSNAKPHLTSWHGLLGFTAAMYVPMQCMGGFNQLYPKLAQRFVRLSTLRQAHATSGLLLMTLATAALTTGMFSSYFVGLVTGTSWYACIACPALILVIVANQVRAAYLPVKQ